MLFDWYTPAQLLHSVEWIRARSSAPVVVLGNYIVLREDFPDVLAREHAPELDAASVKSMAHPG